MDNQWMFVAVANRETPSAFTISVIQERKSCFIRSNSSLPISPFA